MNKILVVVLVLTITFGMVFAFTACGNDAELLRQIEELEQQLRDMEQATTGPQGSIGPEGPQSERGQQGEQGIQGERGPQGDRGPAGPAAPAPELNRIHNVGDTVTVVQNGYELFSITVNSASFFVQDLFHLRLTIRNINMPNIAINEFVGITFEHSNGTHVHAWSSPISLPSIPRGTSQSNILFTGALSDVQYIIFGFPATDRFPIIPYAIFRV